MASSDKKQNLFISYELLLSQYGVEELREYLRKEDIPNHSIISGILENELIVTQPFLGGRTFTLTDTAFEHFVKQKVSEGYVYASLESFKALLGIDN